MTDASGTPSAGPATTPASTPAAGSGRAPAGGGPHARVTGFVLRAALAATGLAALGYGIDGLVEMSRATHPPNSAAWLIGGIVVHDALLVPATMLVGFLLTRLVRAPYRAVAQGALLVSGAVALASLPLWRGYGGSADNATVNPLPYGRNLAIVLGLVWTAAAIIMLSRAFRLRRAQRARQRPEPASAEPLNG